MGIGFFMGVLGEPLSRRSGHQQQCEDHRENNQDDERRDKGATNNHGECPLEYALWLLGFVGKAPGPIQKACLQGVSFKRIGCEWNDRRGEADDTAAKAPLLVDPHHDGGDYVAQERKAVDAAEDSGGGVSDFEQVLQRQA